MRKPIDYFARIGKLVEALDIAEEERQRTGDCLRQLGTLWTRFSQSYESRDLTKFLHLERGLLARLHDDPAPGAHQMAKVLTAQLKGLHERLGLPPILAPAKSKPAPRSRAAS